MNTNEIFLKNADLDGEPRWPALVAALAAGGVYEALPPQLEILPAWYFLAAVVALLIPIVIAHSAKWHRASEIAGYLLSLLMTMALMGSVALLVNALPTHTLSPAVLLRSAGTLWLSNVLVFALWYWRLDAGGPTARDSRAGHPDGAFLFPQMTLSPEDRARTGNENWSPKFVDYLFLAFNASTALSPTDAPVLSRWAKGLMMLQSSISLTVIAVLAARAVNIL
jgi:hypothetical protein